MVLLQNAYWCLEREISGVIEATANDTTTRVSRRLEVLSQRAVDGT